MTRETSVAARIVRGFFAAALVHKVELPLAVLGASGGRREAHDDDGNDQGAFVDLGHDLSLSAYFARVEFWH